MDFLRTQFDKLLLAALIIIGLCFQVHFVHHGIEDAGLMEWMKALLSGFAGALLTLITGRALQRKADANGPDSK